MLFLSKKALVHLVIFCHLSIHVNRSDSEDNRSFISSLQLSQESTISRVIECEYEAADTNECYRKATKVPRKGLRTPT